MNRREALTRIAAVVGGIGAAFAAIPLIRYLVPSARAKALHAPVSVDVSKLQPGHTTSVMWRGKPIMIFRRTPEQLEGIRLSDSQALDDSPPAEGEPASANNKYRSINPEFLVVVSSCTHLGCIPRQDTTIGKDLIGDWWPGGFHCPCHDSMYDNAGRVVRGPAPLNLRIPPYYFSSENEIVFGSESL